MGIVHRHNVSINVNPPLPQGTQISIGLTPGPLLLQGFNVAVEISTATAFRQQPIPPNLQIGSCNLNFQLNSNLNNPRNFGILLGRDVMSRWNIIWNGPSSTVIISD